MCAPERGALFRAPCRRLSFATRYCACLHATICCACFPARVSRRPRAASDLTPAPPRARLPVLVLRRQRPAVRPGNPTESALCAIRMARAHYSSQPAAAFGRAAPFAPTAPPLCSLRPVFGTHADWKLRPIVTPFTLISAGRGLAVLASVRSAAPHPRPAGRGASASAQRSKQRAAGPLQGRPGTSPNRNAILPPCGSGTGGG